MRVTIDLMKKSTQIIDLSNVINPRVGDDDLQLPLHIGYGDNLFDMRGKDVEFLSNDPNKKNIYIAGTCNTNTPGDNLYMGDLTFRFPAGTFKADGTYDPDKTMFRIVDKETQKVISSVNVKITVMKNNIEFDFDPDKSSYDSRLETMLHDFHDKGQAMLDEIKDLNNQANSNVSGDTATTANAAKKQADQNAGDISDLKGEVTGARGRFANMAGREDAQDTAINQKESIVNANANYSALQQKNAKLERRQTALSASLLEKFSQFNVNPEFFTDLNELATRYPNGKEGVFILNNGHTAIYQNGWQDSGHSITVGSFNYRTFPSVDGVIAPYDSLDTLPGNSVVFYSPDVAEALLDFPSFNKFAALAVITIGADSTNSANYGRIQKVINRNTGEEFDRSMWVGSDGKIAWGSWQSLDGLRQITITATPTAPYDDLNTLPSNTIVYYSPLEIKSAPTKSAMIVKTEGPKEPKNANYGKMQTVIDQHSLKRYYRYVWVNNDGALNWGPWSTEDGVSQNVIIDDPVAPYDDLNELTYNTISFYAPTNKVKNNPLSGESFVVETKGPKLLRKDNYGEIQTVIGQRSGKKYYRTRWAGNEGIGDWSNWHCENIDENGLNKVSLSIFDKVTVVGDSYSAGWLLKPDGSSFYDKSKFQWPRLIGKKYGFTVNNLSMSGWTAQDFVNNKLSDIANSKPQDAYIIALGINDQSNGKETLGSKDDLKLNYTTNPDSFYGNMGKIIGTIKENDPNARIMLLTIMRNDGTITDTFNAAIKDVAGYYNLPVADIDSDPYFKTDEYNQRKAGGHPTIVGYGALADHLENVLQQTILDNYDYFCNTASVFDDTQGA